MISFKCQENSIIFFQIIKNTIDKYLERVVRELHAAVVELVVVLKLVAVSIVVLAQLLSQIFAVGQLFPDPSNNILTHNLL